MRSQALLKPVRPTALVFLALALLLLSSVALAAGRIDWKSKELKEREGGSWRVELAFHLPRAPDVAHVPMKFEFLPMVYFERSMVDGDKVVERTVPLEGRQALIESVDVGFLDAGTGKIESRTRFSFKVTRAHGYEAGEYKVTVRDGRGGQTVGAPVTLRFAGENEIIDRRAMVFTGKKKKDEKKDGDAKEAEEKKSEGKKEDATTGEGSGSGDSADKPAAEKAEDGNEESDGPSASNGSEHETIKEKPGGCGCRIEDASRPGTGLLSVGLGLGLIVLVRRRARRRETGCSRDDPSAVAPEATGVWK